MMTANEKLSAGGTPFEADRQGHQRIPNIPAYADNWEITGQIAFPDDVTIYSLWPHMHLRGKDFELRLIFPSGETRTVLKGKWDFNWQLGYDLTEPIDLPVGTRIVSICHYDNSAANKQNPDPSKLIRWGDQNWDEMQNIFVGVLVDPSLDSRTFFKCVRTMISSS